MNTCNCDKPNTLGLDMGSSTLAGAPKYNSINKASTRLCVQPNGCNKGGCAGCFIFSTAAPKPRAEGSSPSAPATGKSPKPQQSQGFRGFSFLPKKLKMQQNMPKNCSKSGTNLVHAWGNRGEFRRRKNGCKPSNTNGLQTSLFLPAGGTRGGKARKTIKKPVWIPIYTIFKPAIDHTKKPVIPVCIRGYGLLPSL